MYYENIGHLLFRTNNNCIVSNIDAAMIQEYWIIAVCYSRKNLFEWIFRSRLGTIEATVNYPVDRFVG